MANNMHLHRLCTRQDNHEFHTTRLNYRTLQS